MSSGRWFDRMTRCVDCGGVSVVFAHVEGERVLFFSFDHAEGWIGTDESQPELVGFVCWLKGERESPPAGWRFLDGPPEAPLLSGVGSH